MDLPKTMHAVLMKAYGDPSVLEYTEAPLPTPKPNQLLIKNYATSVNPLDWKIRMGMLRFLLPIKMPKILGFDYCGQVVQTGDQVKNTKIGDWVYGMTDSKAGCNAEYVCVEAAFAAPKTDSLPALETATLPVVTLTAWQALQKLKPNDSILIIGSTGGVGLAAVQIAVAKGAQITALASPQNFELLKSLGVTECIDYHGYDFKNKQTKYDFIFDTVETNPSTALYQLKSNGIFITTVPGLHFLFTKFKNVFSSKKIHFLMVKPNVNDLKEINNLINKNQLKPKLFATFPLQKLAEAHILSERGHAVGKIAIQISSEK